MAANVPAILLNDVRTDADWIQDFAFTDAGEPHDFTGSAFSLAMVPTSAPQADEGFILDSASGTIVLQDERVGIRVPATEMADRYVGRYRWALREHRDDDSVVTLLFGEVEINQGLSDAVDGDPLVRSAPMSGGGGTVIVNTPSSGPISVLRGEGGPVGKSAYQHAVEGGYEGTEAEFDAGLGQVAENETGRLAAEAARVTAESGRASAETGRVNAEGVRVTAEQGRSTAEGQRVTAETARAGAETARATAEGARSTAETTRTTNETGRVNAESARATAEAARATASAAATTAALDAADVALEAASEVFGVVPVAKGPETVVLTAADDRKRIVTTGPAQIHLDAGLPAAFAAKVTNIGGGAVEMVAGLGPATVNAPGGLTTLTTPYASAAVGSLGGDSFIVEDGEAAAQIDGQARALFDRARASGHALTFFA